MPTVRWPHVGRVGLALGGVKVLPRVPRVMPCRSSLIVTKVRQMWRSPCDNHDGLVSGIEDGSSGWLVFGEQQGLSYQE